MIPIGTSRMLAELGGYLNLILAPRAGLKPGAHCGLRLRDLRVWSSNGRDRPTSPGRLAVT
jgi:hypothetical protein